MSLLSSYRVDRAALMGALKRVRAVTSGAGSIPLLKLARMRAKEGQDRAVIEISATNLEESVRIEIEAEAGAGEGFDVLVPAERIAAFLAGDGEEVVEVGLEGNGTAKIVVEGTARATFPYEPVTDYPEIPVSPEDGQWWRIGIGAAAAIRRAAGFAFAEKVTSNIMDRLRMVYLWEEGGKVVVVGTEQHVLWAETVEAEAPAGGWVALPREAAKGIEACDLVVDGGRVFMAREGEEQSAGVPEGVDAEFLKTALQRVKEEGVEIELSEALPALRAVIARRESENPTRVEIDGFTVKAFASTGTAEADLDVEMPKHTTVYPELTLAGFEALVARGGKVTWAETLNGQALVFRAGEATLVLMGWK